MLIIVSAHLSHAKTWQCKNIYLKKQNTFDCILENMIKKLIIADIQRTPETSGRNVFYLRVRTSELARDSAKSNV